MSLQAVLCCACSISVSLVSRSSNQVDVRHSTDGAADVNYSATRMLDVSPTSEDFRRDLVWRIRSSRRYTVAASMAHSGL